MRVRSGIMLLELVVALAITALVLAGGGFALRTLSQLVETVRLQSNKTEREHNREQLVRSWGRMSYKPDSTTSITGTDSSFIFPSICVTNEGWNVPCNVQLYANTSLSETPAFRITTSIGDSITYGTGPGHIRYLTDASNGGTWADEWLSHEHPPLAVMLDAAEDSLFVRLAPSR